MSSRPSARPPVRVLSLVPRVLHPFQSGGEIRVGALMRRLVPEYEFHVLAFLEAGDERRQAAAAIELERRHGIRSVFCRRTPGLAPDPGKPAIAAAFWDPSMVRTLREEIVARKIDLVQIEFSQMAQYAEHAADLAPVVLTEHDSSVLAPGESYYRTGDDGVAHARLARAHLASCFVHCRRVVAVSDAEAERLEPLAGPGKLRVVPTGVETDRLSFKPADGRRPSNALFVGHYPHSPNEDAAVYLCREILPRLKRSAPGA
ncbi:MAG: glycosyltransferase family 4 protein, partial [Elusimicrobiota bacterium]